MALFDTLLATLGVAGASFLGIYTLWIFYLAAMNLFRAQQLGTLNKIAMMFGWPIIGIGVLLDFLVNIIVLTVLFFELPQEYLVTKRLARHAQGPDGYRKKTALFICSTFLDTFDPSGDHC
jgi:hypothetical protein